MLKTCESCGKGVEHRTDHVESYDNGKGSLNFRHTCTPLYRDRKATDPSPEDVALLERHVLFYDCERGRCCRTCHREWPCHKAPIVPPMKVTISQPHSDGFPATLSGEYRGIHPPYARIYQRRVRPEMF